MKTTTTKDEPKAWREVLVAITAAEEAENSSYYDLARICQLRNAAEQAEREFAEQHPGAYAEKVAAWRAHRSGRQAKTGA